MVAKMIEEVSRDLALVRFEEVDVTARPEVAVRYGVTATPAIAINGRLAFTGVPREEALRARLRAAPGDTG